MATIEVAGLAALVGMAGSLGYITALFFGFLTNDPVLAKLRSSGQYGKIRAVATTIWFTLIGGAVALIFQLPEAKLVPIQAFIMGTTWPTVVAQILTTRGESKESIKAQILSLLGE